MSGPSRWLVFEIGGRRGFVPLDAGAKLSAPSAAESEEAVAAGGAYFLRDPAEVETLRRRCAAAPDRRETLRFFEEAAPCTGPYAKKNV
jgi:hypothetical protein